jgi:hypothetical protein
MVSVRFISIHGRQRSVESAEWSPLRFGVSVTKNLDTGVFVGVIQKEGDRPSFLGELSQAPLLALLMELMPEANTYEASRLVDGNSDYDHHFIETKTDAVAWLLQLPEE